MTGRDFEKLCLRYVLPELNGFGVKGGLLLAIPAEYLLRGFCVNSSAFDNSFALEAFVQPLYVPCDHVYFNFGNRLGRLKDNRERWWLIDEQNEASSMEEILGLIKDVGLPFIDTWKTPDDFVRRAFAHCGDPRNPHRLQTQFYSAILVDDVAAGRSSFQKLKTHIEGSSDRRPWLLQLLKESTELYDAWQSDPQKAKDMLNRWTEETKAALRLDKAKELRKPIERGEKGARP
jgi:hypothetical protein